MAALETLEVWMRGVKDDANRKANGRGEQEPAVDDWWAAVIGQGNEAEEDEENGPYDDEDENEEQEAESHTETHTTATLKGIVHTSVIRPSDEPEAHASGSASPSTIQHEGEQKTVLAIGLGAQILPGKGEPLELDPDARQTVEPSQVARDALEDVQGAMDDVRERVGEGVKKAGNARGAVEGAERRMERRMGKEVRRGGWRSKAFDL